MVAIFIDLLMNLLIFLDGSGIQIINFSKFWKLKKKNLITNNIWYFFFNGTALVNKTPLFKCWKQRQQLFQYIIVFKLLKTLLSNLLSEIKWISNSKFATKFKKKWSTLLIGGIERHSNVTSLSRDSSFCIKGHYCTKTILHKDSFAKKGHILTSDYFAR